MQTLSLTKQFHQMGHRILLIVPDKSTLFFKAKEAAIPVETLNGNNRNILSDIFRVRKIIRTFSPQIIHTQLSHDLWFLVPAIGKMKKISLVLTRRMASNVKKKDIFHRYLYARVNLLLCISNFIRENVLTTTTIKPEKVEVHYNGLNSGIFHPEKFNRAVCRSKFNISEDAIVIGFLGRFSFMKGHDEFFEAGKILLERFPEKNLIFLVAGGDSFGEEAYGEATRRKGLSILGKQLIFTGEVHNAPEVLKCMNILAFPSHEESFGNVLCEAGAMEIPVVASSNGGIPDIVEHNRTGLLVEPENANALAEALAGYIRDSEKAQKHGQNARHHVIEKFEEHRQLLALEKRYQMLCV